MAEIKLRPYQEHAVQNAVEMLAERGNSLIVAGTGAGKTIMMAAAIGRFANGFYAKHKRRPHVLALVHRTEIHSQNRTKFEKVCPELATSEITANRKSLHGYVHFGMVQTVVNLLPEFAAANSYFDLIVIDEAHHSKASTYEEIINWNKQGNPDACLLGVTATPNRGDKLPLIELFDNFNQITTRFLIDSHYLVRPKFIDLTPTFHHDEGEELGHLSKNCKLDDIFGRELIKKLCEEYLRVKNKGKTVIFAPSHEYCTFIFDTLKELGRNPAYLSKGLDELTRKQTLDSFENGECDELINVDICTEGYDYPQLQNLVDFDTNGTQGQWIQKVGRVLRTAPGKTTCTVIDFGGNVKLYPDGVETDVNLNGVVKKPKGEHLTAEELFKPREQKETSTKEYTEANEQRYTPYNPPQCFETVLDKDYGIVLVACGDSKDFILLNRENEYTAFYGNKTALTEYASGEFETLIKKGIEFVGNVTKPDKPISALQVSLLAPEYATTAMDWYGANCHICWKVWKGEIAECLKRNAKLKN